MIEIDKIYKDNGTVPTAIMPRQFYPSVVPPLIYTNN